MLGSQRLIWDIIDLYPDRGKSKSPQCVLTNADDCKLDCAAMIVMILLDLHGNLIMHLEGF
jgi:hypothetical protein